MFDQWHKYGIIQNVMALKDGLRIVNICLLYNELRTSKAFDLQQVAKRLVTSLSTKTP